MTNVKRELTPSAARLTNSLRDIGYEFVTAVADLVDNSVSSGASTIEIQLKFDGPDSQVLIADDGSGMSPTQIDEAMRFGTRRAYDRDELGRYGLGLKTGSLSQCRRLSVVSRRAPIRRWLSTRVLDIDHVNSSDKWEILDQATPSVLEFAATKLSAGPGTVVAWEQLDRVLPERNREGGWARRRLLNLAEKTNQYLGMVFHRYLVGGAGQKGVVITVNGHRVDPWDPFATAEPKTIELPKTVLELEANGVGGFVTFHPFVLPPRNRFSSQQAFDYCSGPQKWNRQQGLYIYRTNRLIQAGGWSGIRAIDEHTKLARASLEFDSSLDELLQTNVAKMKVNIPARLRAQLERPIKELCQVAEESYRHAAVRKAATKHTEVYPDRQLKDTGAALLVAAVKSGETASLERIMSELRSSDKALASALGW